MFFLLMNHLFMQSAVVSLLLARTKLTQGGDDACPPQTDPGSQYPNMLQKGFSIPHRLSSYDVKPDTPTTSNWS